jgi:hypothetical protein
MTAVALPAVPLLHMKTHLLTLLAVMTASALFAEDKTKTVDDSGITSKTTRKQAQDAGVPTVKDSTVPKSDTKPAPVRATRKGVQDAGTSAVKPDTTETKK